MQDPHWADPLVTCKWKRGPPPPHSPSVLSCLPRFEPGQVSPEPARGQGHSCPLGHSALLEGTHRSSSIFPMPGTWLLGVLEKPLTPEKAVRGHCSSTRAGSLWEPPKPMRASEIHIDPDLPILALSRRGCSKELAVIPAAC